MPTKKPNKTKEVIAKIFKNPIMLYGLKEFEGIDDLPEAIVKLFATFPVE